MIITDEEILRKPCEMATDDEAREIIVALENELKKSAILGNPGIGLAAPQIGIHKNVAIVRLDNSSAYPMNANLINAKIINKYDLFKFEGEGCLSYPGRYENSMRYNEIVIESASSNFIATGLFSVVIQHELDHLVGRLLPDIALKPSLRLNKTKPNEPCPCLSGKKYKKCHGAS